MRKKKKLKSKEEMIGDRLLNRESDTVKKSKDTNNKYPKFSNLYKICMPYSIIITVNQRINTLIIRVILAEIHI